MEGEQPGPETDGLAVTVRPRGNLHELHLSHRRATELRGDEIPQCQVAMLSPACHPDGAGVRILVGEMFQGHVPVRVPVSDDVLAEDRETAGTASQVRRHELGEALTLLRCREPSRLHHRLQGEQQF